DRHEARGVGDVSGRLIAADLGIARGVDQIDIEETVAGEARIEGEAEQTALADGRDLARHVEGPRRQNLAGERSRVLLSPVFSTRTSPPVSPGGAGANSGWFKPVATRVARMLLGWPCGPFGSYP